MPNEDSDQTVLMHRLICLEWANVRRYVSGRCGSFHCPHTVFDRNTAHTPISAQSSNFVVFRLLAVYFFSTFFYKGICCGCPFELHRLVDAIQMSINSICFYKETQKKKMDKHHQISPLLICFCFVLFYVVVVVVVVVVLSVPLAGRY